MGAAPRDGAGGSTNTDAMSASVPRSGDRGVSREAEGERDIAATVASIGPETTKTSVNLLPPRVGAEPRNVGANDNLDLEAWGQAFDDDENIAPTSQDRIEFNDAGFKIQEKWHRNKSGTWRGYYVRRWFGIVRVGATAGRRGKLSKHIRGSRILGRESPKRSRGGRRRKQADPDTVTETPSAPVSL